jgi:hypothetical protein
MRSPWVSAGGHADEREPWTWLARAADAKLGSRAASSDRQPLCHRLDGNTRERRDAGVIRRSAYRVTRSTTSPRLAGFEIREGEGRQFHVAELKVL